MSAWPKIAWPKVATSVEGNDVDKWNWEGKIDPPDGVIKRMVSLILGNMVKIIMENHLYSAGGKLCRQMKGGPIGLKLAIILSEC